MIGIDTNLLIRILIEDDAEQLKRARTLLNGMAERFETVFVADIVLAELEWVLEDAYQVPRARILQALQAIVASKQFEFQDRRRVLDALELYQKGKAELSDYLVGLIGSQRGASTTYTFDRDLRDDERFTLL